MVGWAYHSATTRESLIRLGFDSLASGIVLAKRLMWKNALLMLNWRHHQVECPWRGRSGTDALGRRHNISGEAPRSWKSFSHEECNSSVLIVVL